MGHKHITVGILAHVDAGKTTLSEALLYLGGNIRTLGRVDHKDAFFDTFAIERKRGITVFSKQARLSFDGLSMTLLDTPGHVDFSSEMERNLQVLDYAILVLSGASGVQSHTLTLWNLLKLYQVPVFVFVNKMDQEVADPEALLAEIQHKLGDRCIDFSSDDTITFYEQIALVEEKLMDDYLEQGIIELTSIQRIIREWKVAPVYFGSALQLRGVEELVQGLKTYCINPTYGEDFAARVFKVTRDESGNRLTHIKLTGGILSVRDRITYSPSHTQVTSDPMKKGGTQGLTRLDAHAYDSSLNQITEKVNQIRLYSGDRFETVNQVQAGDICTITGLSASFPGLGLGEEPVQNMSYMSPVLRYKVEYPSTIASSVMLKYLKELEEEDPKLHVLWNEPVQEIQIQLMGEVQGEIVQTLCEERFGIPIQFSTGEIMYRETIESATLGVGHYEPLRHYAEVHLLLEPLPRGSGIVVESNCSVDLLASNYQQQVLERLCETEYNGCSIGYPITDLRVTLINGRAHNKHTEGGDFREATDRALRQGLRRAQMIILEPMFQFQLQIPTDFVGRAMNDLNRMSATFDPPKVDGEFSILLGQVPAATLEGYHTELMSYTGGRSNLETTFVGYENCHNAEQVVQRLAYDVESDNQNNADSVFCSHGAGFIVKWYEVEQYQHIESDWSLIGLEQEDVVQEMEQLQAYHERMTQEMSNYRTTSLTQEELDAIYTRTPDPTSHHRSITVYGTDQQEHISDQMTERMGSKNRKKRQKSGQEYLLVDGYNVIHAWPNLKKLAQEDLAAARDRLIDILSNYQGYKQQTLILVFDAYKVEGGMERIYQHHNIHVVYTKEAETADHYIERTVMQMPKHHHITVATSDAMEQMIVLGQGAFRMSAEGLRKEVKQTLEEMREQYLKGYDVSKRYLFDALEEELAEELELIRVGKSQRNEA